ncbi:hypothetical protein QBC39DRAFT_356231 [Podospora conica]|nr:hypothetical protein QBC39DRAFT_356231 [Schizothecium conicum]
MTASHTTLPKYRTRLFLLLPAEIGTTACTTLFRQIRIRAAALPLVTVIAQYFISGHQIFTYMQSVRSTLRCFGGFKKNRSHDGGVMKWVLLTLTSPLFSSFPVVTQFQSHCCRVNRILV